MKILVVDDDNNKIQKIKEAISDGAGSSDITVDCVFTISDAKQKLSLSVYDLMILDIVVPFRAGDSPRSKSSEDLLIEIRDRSTLKKPKQVIGLTAFEEGFNALQSVFSGQCWTIIRYQQDSSEWKGQVTRSISYLLKATGESTDQQYRTDVVIISALENPEHNAIRQNGWDWSTPEPLDDTVFYQKASFQSQGNHFTAASAYCHKFGMVSAALLSAKLIEKLRPKYIAMPGICAGVKGKANYGDVIIAEPCWDWQVGKHLIKDGNKEFAIQPEQLTIPNSIRSKWDQLRLDLNFLSSVKQKWPSSPDTELKIKIGPAVSGSSVLADVEIVEAIKSQHRGLLAVEMEAFAVFSAAQHASRPRPIAFTCKSICDFADEKKDDKWQAYASYTSASTLTAFLERYMNDLSSELN